MAIAHFSVSIISRGDGRSAVLSAAYRHCAKMEFEREARFVDYTRKHGLIHEAFVVPRDAPPWLRVLIADRSVAEASAAFWNKLEAFEKRADAQLAKEIIMALPLELSAEQNIALVGDFVEQYILQKGQVADWVYHDAPGNPHVHLMTTLRPLGEGGFGDKKIAVVGEDGEVVRNKAGKIIYRLWAGGVEEFAVLRSAWFETQNQHLAFAGFELRVDGRSYDDRGIDLVATPHIGVRAKAIQRKSDAGHLTPKLERIDELEARRRENARRILKRPKIVLEMIAAEKSVFDERDVAKILHRYIDDLGDFRRLMTRIIQSPDALRLERDGVDFATGGKVHARYTTRELIRIEARMARQSFWLFRRATHGVRDKVLDAVFGRHAQLSQEQRVAVRHVTAKARISAVVGRAGAGKTTMMKAAREGWELAGYKVVGAALAGKAAEALEKEAGIVSRTLASWELLWKQGRLAMDPKTVFVVDEAGMVASRQMARLVDEVTRLGAKLVLVGDPEQLQPIEAGAPFRAIVDRIGYVELETIFRQREEWMRKASLDLARGRVAQALAAYSQHAKVRSCELKGQVIERLIADWNSDYDPTQKSLILAHLRRDVRELNRLARAKLVERGIVKPGHSFAAADGLRHFDAGDQVVFLKNETSLGVKNGMIGCVVEASPNRFVAAVGEGSQRCLVKVEQRFYPHVDHGYATTIHKSQGSTVDQVKVLASLSIDRHLAYVAMTRHRYDLSLYYGRRSFARAGGLELILSRMNAKQTTLDYERGALYRQALRFAECRGLNIARVARTLAVDRLDWTLRQRDRLTSLVQRLRSCATSLSLWPQLSVPLSKKAVPMVGGVKVFAQTLGDVVDERLAGDRSLSKLWAETSKRFSHVFADPEAAFAAMNLNAALADGAAARNTLDRLVLEPASFGSLKGKVGFFASKSDVEARRVAKANAPALKLDLERYLKVRNAAAELLRHQETANRQRAGIDIPSLSALARSVLKQVHEAFAQGDLGVGVHHMLEHDTAKLEIDAFNRALAQRFGERYFLGHAACEPSGPAFEKACEGLTCGECEKLRLAWPLMRAAQQIGAHERATMEVTVQREGIAETLAKGVQQ